MALYAMGDLHLCLGAPKPMDVFGGAWVGYMEKLKQGLSVITEKDTLVLMGDLSWALDLNSAVADFAWINEIPGKKDYSEGQSRLLVEYPGKIYEVLPGKRVFGSEPFE